MKKSLIISSHCDDAPFSLGSFISDLGEVIIASPFDGIPEDAKGKSKHTLLNWEHEQVCDYLGANIISGHFFDDVYKDTRDLSGLVDWFGGILATHKDYDVYCPLGIKHVDHVIVRDIFVKHFNIDYFYCELPYYIRWQNFAQQLELTLCSNRKLITKQVTNGKEIACKMYASQTDEGVLKDILVQERIWR